MQQGWGISSTGTPEGRSVEKRLGHEMMKSEIFMKNRNEASEYGLRL